MGKTRGFSKCNNKYYENFRPKAVFIYPLCAKAKEILTSNFPIGNNIKEAIAMVNSLPIEKKGGSYRSNKRDD